MRTESEEGKVVMMPVLNSTGYHSLEGLFLDVGGVCTYEFIDTIRCAENLLWMILLMWTPPAYYCSCCF